MVLEVNKNKTRQAITGFGGAFTDAAGINIASLPKAAQVKLIQAYFATDGEFMKLFVCLKPALGSCLCVYMCVCVCVHVCVHECMRVHTFLPACPHTCLYVLHAR